MMPIIDVDINNIDCEHICCAISDKKGENCVGSKKEWMRARFADGLVFKKLDERGKVFIEYIPAEYAFAPIEAPEYMYINCFWVSGKYKGQGYANELLDACIKDAKAKGKAGLVVLTSDKKRPFLSDPGYLKYKGFAVCDTAQPYFRLMYLPFESEAATPKFKPQAKSGTIADEGIVIYYSHQCPHTEKYVNIVDNSARKNDIKLKTLKIETVAQAQNAPTPFTTYALFKDGRFITQEILTEKKFLKIAGG